MSLGKSSPSNSNNSGKINMTSESPKFNIPGLN